MKGAFQTSREIFENPIWTDIPKFRIFFYIYGNAVFAKEGTTVAGMHLKRGQFLRSYRNLREDLAYIENRSVKKYSLAVIKRKIDSLVKENRLKTEESELGTLFTVVNYEIYQGLDNYKKENLEQRWNADGTELEQGWNNNKNDKNVNKEEEEENPFKLFEENICMLNPLNRDSLINWCEELGDELIIAAIKLGAKYNARSYKYVEDIFKEWVQQNIKTVEDARLYVKEKNKRTSNIVDFSSKKKANGVDWGGFDISD